ncbi:MAG: CPBP family intramembrane metalloprotease [Chloroflexi bacterium]|nr:CPBP family intramembrane metalloprotease [Chloroflexota bacterium]
MTHSITHPVTHSVTHSLDLKRITIYILFAFGVAWAAGLVIYLTGGLAGSPYAILLLTVAYMGAPAIAHVLTRLVTREGWHSLYLRPRLRQGWPYWLLCWFVPGVFTLAGAALYFALFPQYFDPALSTIQQMMQQSAQQAGQAAGTVAAMNPWTIVIVQTVQALLIAPILNALPIFGEEFGWRAYLQPKLMPLGGRRAMLLMGVIWGVWHWPVIAMGHNYGLNYPGAPWLGLLMMVWFTFVAGTFLGWATLRAGSVWPAVIGHGALNGIGAIGLLLAQGQPNLLLGPIPAGLIGSVGFAIVALLLYLSPHTLAPRLLE